MTNTFTGSIRTEDGSISLDGLTFSITERPREVIRGVFQLPEGKRMHLPNARYIVDLDDGRSGYLLLDGSPSPRAGIYPFVISQDLKHAA